MHQAIAPDIPSPRIDLAEWTTDNQVSVSLATLSVSKKSKIGPQRMHHTDRKTLALRVLAVVLCVSVLVFFSALLMHHHGISGHEAHCQMCALGHSTPSTTAAASLIVTMEMLMLFRVCAPSRGSPSFVALPTTRPPPASL